MKIDHKAKLSQKGNGLGISILALYHRLLRMFLGSNPFYLSRRYGHSVHSPFTGSKIMSGGLEYSKIFVS